MLIDAESFWAEAVMTFKKLNSNERMRGKDPTGEMDGS